MKTFKEVVDMWIEDKQRFVKESTMSVYKLQVHTHLLPIFGEKETIVESEVQQFVLDRLEKKMSERTVHDILIVLKMIVRWANKYEGWDCRTDWQILFPTKREQRDMEVMSLKDQQKLSRYLKENFSFKNLGLFICLYSGLRIGEVCGLKWSDFDPSSGTLTINRTVERIYVIDSGKRASKVVVNTPKTASSMRTIPLNKEVLKIMKKMIDVVNSSYYIISNSMDPLEPRTYRNHYNSILKELDIPKIKFHGLRHSFATRCVENQCDYKTVSVLLGHADVSTTLNLYVHPNMEHKKKCINKIGKILGMM